jgi:hypothetical protein
LICDELEFSKPGVLKDVIMPLLQNKDTVFVGISTPLGKSGTWRSEMSELKRDNGENIFIVKEVGLLCTRCEKRGLTECPHVDMTPSWKDSERGAELMSKLYANDPTRLKRETLGLATDSANCFFDYEHIERMKNNVRVPIAKIIPDNPFVFVTVDPGGNGSLTAIASTIRMVGSMQVRTSVSLRHCLHGRRVTRSPICTSAVCSQLRRACRRGSNARPKTAAV